MNSVKKVLYNENLLNFIIPYLNTTDLTNISSTNSRIYSSTNRYWYDKCKNKYTSTYEEFSVFGLTKGSITSNNASFMFEPVELFPIDWKAFYSSGKQIQFMYEFINPKKEARNLCEVVFGEMKEYWTLPPLRKPHLYVESELNTTHQTFLYDFLYETQEHYGYYTKQLKTEKNSILVNRKDNLLFTDFILNFHNIKDNLSTEDKQTWKNLRFYHLNIPNLNCLEFHHNSINAYIKGFSANFKNIISDLTSEINRSRDNDILYWDNIQKRYKSFCECAVSINEKCENINIVTNLLYEHWYHNNQPIHPRFSVYRWMWILFNRIVLAPWWDETNERNIISVTTNWYQISLHEELKKSINSFDDERDLSTMSTLQSNCNNMLINSNFNDSNFEIESQRAQWLEQIPWILWDGICNEYSVFYINSSKFPIENTNPYSKLIDKMISKACDVIKAIYTKDTKNDWLSFFEEDELINQRLINLSKYQFKERIKETLLNEGKSDFMEEFHKYLLKKLSPGGMDINDNCSSIHSNDNSSCMDIDEESSEDECEGINIFNFPYYCDMSSELDWKVKEEMKVPLIKEFIKEYTHNKNYNWIKRVMSWESKSLHYIDEQDESVWKETKRRNILLNKGIFNSQTWNFEMKLLPETIISLMEKKRILLM